MKKILFFTTLIFWVCPLLAQKSLIPIPQQIKIEHGFYSLSNDFRVLSDARITELQYFEKRLNGLGGKMTTVKNKPNLQFTFLKDKGLRAGFYKLSINKHGVLISSKDSQGLFYGLETLLQLIQEHQNDRKIPYLEITDYPKFDYRGMMLDVSRHFFTVKEVKRFLDYMAAYKYNKFHWHLTDDQGWRIQIKKYPKLTEVGAWRDSSQVGPYGDWQFEKGRYGGFYTQDEVKEVVAYAKMLHIDVIPEIEMPGHSQAAIAAYPELGCTDKRIGVWTQWGVSENIYCPTETTFKFLQNVLDEVMPLFPYGYIHIGGDEAPKQAWKNSAFCQNLIKELGLKDEDQLQSYFITRMEKYVNSKGKHIIGWNEILEGGLAPNATVQSWTGVQGGIEAAKSGHKAIMSPIQSTYFSRYQGNVETQRLAPGGYTSLKMVYGYDPIPKQLAPAEARYIWGTEGAIWTEYIADFPKVQYMAFPRMLALSEVAWGTAKPEDYDGFQNRVIMQMESLKTQGIDYSRAIFEVNSKIIQQGDGFFDTLFSEIKDGEIRYSTDGTDPSTNSKVYQKPVPISDGMILRAAYFRNGAVAGATNSQKFALSNGILLQYPVFSTNTAEASADVRIGKDSMPSSSITLQGNDLYADIAFGTPTYVSKVVFLAHDAQLELPDHAKITVLTSVDGKHYKDAGSLTAKDILKGNPLSFNISFYMRTARFIRILMADFISVHDPGKNVIEIKVN